MAPGARSELLRPYYPALDGLRALAFLSVFASHYINMFYGMAWVKWCWTGVNLFFVLSGFLITGILYDTLQKPDYFRNFYVRRALRIFPLFYGVWLALLVLTPLLHVGWTRMNVMMVAYVGNFFETGYRMHRNVDPGLVSYVIHGVTRHVHLGHLWTLCVEEQFYIAWPAVVWLVKTRQALLRLCLALMVGMPVLRALYAYTYPDMMKGGALYFSTFSHIDTLICGAAIALWMRGSMPSIKSLKPYLIAVVVLMPVLLVVGHSIFADVPVNPPRDVFVCVFGYSFIAFGYSALLMLSLESGTLLSRVLQVRPLVYLGRISYGLYLYHFMPFEFFASRRHVLIAHHLAFLGPVLALAFTVAVASLSFRYFETPFLQLKKQFAPSRGAVDDPAPASSYKASLLSGATVEVE